MSNASQPPLTALKADHLPCERSFYFPLPRHKSYVETRGSRGAYLFLKPRSPLEVLNDSDGEAINLSRILIDEKTRLEALGRYGEDVRSSKINAIGESADRIARAVSFTRQIESSLRRHSPSSYRLNRRSTVVLSPALQRIDRAVERLRKVQLEDRPSAELLPQYDWSQALFVCDERSRDWDAPESVALIRELNAAKGKVVLVVEAEPKAVTVSKRWKQLSCLHPAEVWVNY